MRIYAYKDIYLWEFLRTTRRLWEFLHKTTQLWECMRTTIYLWDFLRTTWRLWEFLHKIHSYENFCVQWHTVNCVSTSNLKWTRRTLPTSSTKVKERVELYFYSASVTSLACYGAKPILVNNKYYIVVSDCISISSFYLYFKHNIVTCTKII